MEQENKFSGDGEAILFGRYILRETPAYSCIRLYNSAAHSHLAEANPTDEKLMRFIFNVPGSLRFIDAGLAVSRPGSMIRKKLFYMVAILECQPQYASFFLSKKRGPTYIFNIVWYALNASGKAIAGVFLIKLIGWMR